MTDDRTPADALVRTVQEAAVSYDGLDVSQTDGTYTFETTVQQEAGLSEAKLRTLVADDPFVDNWYHWTQNDLAPETIAFCRWLEHAPEQSVPDRYAALTSGGVVRTWGQLRITVTRQSGKRRYELRHVDDGSTAPASLDRYDDPLAAREIATTDERGQYRPLKTAPTLATGWLFPALTTTELVRAVDYFYPATIQNWALEREDALDVTHWEDAAERQSGIYAMVDELGGEQLEWLTAACCVDSQCCKRREWDEAPDESIDTPRGTGEFPCREPCSVVISAARKWTLLEREQPQRYTFELTPSEKEQLEALVDAVADGRTDTIREAEFSEPANRHRVRYLRAKRFDDDGTLDGVPTDGS